jgi:Carboxypeptidase regulatory-like domain
MDKKSKTGLVIAGAAALGLIFFLKKGKTTPTPEGNYLTGTITDASTNQPISGAKVTLGAISTTSDASGVYLFNNLTVGTYPLTVTKAGYQEVDI